MRPAASQQVAKQPPGLEGCPNAAATAMIANVAARPAWRISTKHGMRPSPQATTLVDLGVGMAKTRFRVGIVGLQPGESCANRAHLPALRSLIHDFEVVGIANTTLASAEKAAAACGIPRAFSSAAELAASPDVDVVTVTVRVPQHLEVVRTALSAGKHIYCEWPLGNGLAEAEEIAALAQRHGVLGIAGCQARVAPEIMHLRRLIEEGFVGGVLSSSLTATRGGWGASIPSKAVSGYLLDHVNGATMLTIPVGHTLAAVRDVLGELSEVSALLATRRQTVTVMDTGEMLPMTAPDQVLLEGLLGGAVPFSMHYRGGSARGAGLAWDIHGTDGDLRITAASGHTQLEQLTLEGARTADREMSRLVPPPTAGAGWPDGAMAGNVARVYARLANDLRAGSRTAPDFADAVQLHRVIAAIEQAASSRMRVQPDASNRQLPMDVDAAGAGSGTGSAEPRSPRPTAGSGRARRQLV